MEGFEDFEEFMSEQGWTQTKPPSNEAGYEKKILVVPKAVQPKNWLFMTGVVPIGEAGAGTNLRGHFDILEREFGIKGDHEPNFREYFLFGKKWNGRFVVRRVRVPLIRYEDEKQVKLKQPVYRWVMWKTKDQSRFAKLLRLLEKRKKKIPNKDLLFKLYPFEEEVEEGLGETLESFEWALPIEKIESTEDGVLIEGIAINEGMTRNLDVFSRNETIQASRSLIGKPLELDHVPDYGIITDANWNNEKNRVEYRALITNPYAQRLALENKLKSKVSVRAKWRKRIPVDGFLLVGLWFDGLSLMYRREPADIKTSMRIVKKMFAFPKRFERASMSFSLRGLHKGRPKNPLEQEKWKYRCSSHGYFMEAMIERRSNGTPKCPFCNRQLKIVS